MILISILVAAGLTACGTTSSVQPSANGPIKVVAAENFWGSIAKQIGGDKVDEVSIITNPDTDPHDYDATAADSRTMAQAQVAIVNGIGYDPWATKLLSANNNRDRQIINVGDLTGHKDGDNPHRWYSPTDVTTVIDSITESFKKADPKDSVYFDAQQATFQNTALASYHSLLDNIKTKYTGVPVGATESIFSPLAQYLGLDLETPSGFLNAISEGDDPTVADKTTADQQVENKQIKVLVFNSQNATPDVQTMVNAANSAKIPVVSVTETLSPANASFESWQVAQLQALQSALSAATGR